MTSVAVIGAGGAGLAMARYLGAHPNLFKFVVYEQSSDVGGTWTYDSSFENLYDDKSKRNGHKELTELIAKDGIHSSMYKGLRTNLPKQVMEYPDFPFPKTSRTFLRHEDVLNYLKDYCAHFGLRKFIKFNTKVKNVAPVFNEDNDESKISCPIWRLTTVDEENTERISEFSSVIICNGHFTVPQIPEIPNINKFQGRVTHSHFYRVPEPYKDMNVIVLGARASGRDIALEVSKVAKKVMLSHSGNHGSSPLPSNITEAQSIKEIDGCGRVVFMNGEVTEADAIIYCTGYLFDFPFLDKTCGITVENGKVSPVYKQLFNAYYPSMAFIGLGCIVCPFQLFSMQSRWIINVLSGEVNLPTTNEMLKDYHDEIENRLKAGIEERHFHRFPKGMQWDYYKTISELGKVEPMKNVVEKLSKTVATERETNLLHYREAEYIAVDDETFEVC